MTETLEDLLAEARDRLMEEDYRQAEAIEELQQLCADNEKRIMKLACDMLPEPVREFVLINSHDSTNKHYALMIPLPGDVAPIFMDVDVSYDEQGSVKALSAQYRPRTASHPYQVNEYAKYFDEYEGIYKLTTRDLSYLSFDTFDKALVEAVHKGNNKVAVEAEIHAANHKLALEVGIEIKETVLQCPLSMVEGEQRDCVGSRCAWWMRDGGVEPACAIAILARGWARANE